MAKLIFVGGTASHVGKSWMATAICRYLYRRGFRVAPFKAQNMSNNSAPCPTGGEIGRAQAVQAEACGLLPEPDMNPVLLKPTGDMGSQVVVRGQVWGNLLAREYYQHQEWLFRQSLEAFCNLAGRFGVIVIEGAGSIAEVNLRGRDIVNLPLAARLGAPVLLVADIDRGGVFGSLVGTLCVLEDKERQLVRAYAINKFRGDPALFAGGLDFLRHRLQRPCLGVFPWNPDIQIDPEDAVSLEDPTEPGHEIAILRLPHISNFTDFRLLPQPAWITRPVERSFRVVILPGTKNTLADLEWLRARQLDVWIQRQHQGGAQIVGICGGYQILGECVQDPHQVESARREAAGLGLLPVRTVLTQRKQVRAVRAKLSWGPEVDAYEIHMGVTERPTAAEPFAWIDGQPEGIVVNNCWGTYLHGLFEHPETVRRLLNVEPKPLAPKAEMYDRLADWFSAHADLEQFEAVFL